MANTSAIDTALFAVLSGDATLAALAPGGVFRDVSPQGAATPFVIVSQAVSEDHYSMSGPALEVLTYMVKAVDQSTSGASAQAAANRIYALLQGATLSISGYRSLLIDRHGNISYVELDDVSDVRWQHRGGMYVLTAEIV